MKTSPRSSEEDDEKKPTPMDIDAGDAATSGDSVSSVDFWMPDPMSTDDEDEQKDGRPPLHGRKRHLRQFGDYAVSACKEQKLRQRRGSRRRRLFA